MKIFSRTLRNFRAKCNSIVSKIRLNSEKKKFVRSFLFLLIDNFKSWVFFAENIVIITFLSIQRGKRKI